MNHPRCLWSDYSLSTGIAAIACYAGVFNDVVGIEEMASRLGVAGHVEFYTALHELQHQGRLILKDGFACLPHLEHKIGIKASKIATTTRLIDSRLAAIKKLGRNPIIKFVGVSGSLAANNPIPDRDNHLDIDIFLITRNQCLWLYIIQRNLENLFVRKKRSRHCAEIM